MQGLAVTLVFNPPSLPAVLTCAAGAGLLWELVSLVRRIGRGRGLWGAIGVPAAVLIAAPAIAPIAGLCAAMGTGPWSRRGGARLAGASAWALLIYALGAAVVFWWGGGAVVALAACAIFWAVRSYRRTTAPITAGVKRTLLAMRVGVLLLLALWAIGPALEFERTREIRGVMLIGVDVSGSMRLRDVSVDPSLAQDDSPERISRIEAVANAIAESRSELERTAERTDLEWFAFAESARPLEDGTAPPDLPPADGPATALGDATAEAFDPFAASGRDVVAILLLTDGCNNTSETIAPRKLATLMGSRGVPIHTVAVGSETPVGALRSLRVRQLSAPDEVDAFHRLPITAYVESIGLTSREVRVICKFDDEEVAARVVSVAGGRERTVVRFVHVPLHGGFHRLTVSAEVVGGRPRGLVGEARAGKLVHVRDRGIRILYVESRFRYESKYIAQALAAGERFTIDRRVLLKPDSAGRFALSGRMDDWLPYHAIVLGDVPASFFTQGQLEIIRKLVGDYGKGLCMIGGARAFGAGGWARTPVADVLGIDMSASSEQIDGEVEVVPTGDGEASEIMRIGEDGEDPASAWAKLRKLPGANRLGGPKPAAVVLAQTPDGSPLIVAQRYGKGRSLAIAFDTTWRWVLSPDQTASYQKRFWRQVGLYLAAPKGNVWITTDKTGYDFDRLVRRGEGIEVRAGVEDFAGRPLPHAEMNVTLTSPDGRVTPVELQIVETMRRGKLRTPPGPGLYRLKVVAAAGEEPLEAEHQFEVLRRDLEALEILADHELLRRISAESNGRHVTIDGLRELLRDLRTTAEPRTETVVMRHDLAETMRWYVVVLLIALLCAEWIVRKRKGLI